MIHTLLMLLQSLWQMETLIQQKVWMLHSQNPTELWQRDHTTLTTMILQMHRIISSHNWSSLELAHSRVSFVDHCWLTVFPIPLLAMMYFDTNLQNVSSNLVFWGFWVLVSAPQLKFLHILSCFSIDIQHHLESEKYGDARVFVFKIY